MNLKQLQSILEDKELTLLYFSTPSCSVCKVMRPKVEVLLAETPPWHFEYINTEESMEVAGQHMVFAVPTLLLMAEGKEICRYSRHFSLVELEMSIRRYAEIRKG
jgi:thioredoxin-like negative regulator of GroEL